MKQTFKKATDIIIGDKIVDDNGDILTVTDITNGVFFGSKLLKHKKGFSNVLNMDKIQVLNPLI